MVSAGVVVTSDVDRRQRQMCIRDRNTVVGGVPVKFIRITMASDGIVRLSKIEVWPEYLDAYLKYAAEVGEISLRCEPGVLTMYAVREKENPCRITILET